MKNVQPPTRSTTIIEQSKKELNHGVTPLNLKIRFISFFMDWFNQNLLYSCLTYINHISLCMSKWTEELWEGKLSQTGWSISQRFSTIHNWRMFPTSVVFRDWNDPLLLLPVTNRSIVYLCKCDGTSSRTDCSNTNCDDGLIYISVLSMCWYIDN